MKKTHTDILSKCFEEGMDDHQSIEIFIRDHYQYLLKTESTIKAFAYLRPIEEIISDIPKGGHRLSLQGIPYAVKDNIHIQGLPTEAGSKILKGYTSDRTATIIKRLHQAGVLLFGKTTMAEFASGGGAPATKNPWNTQHTPGGSSSGSAASVAAGMISFAIGTQTSGSVIRPASYCGVSALKPTFGQISRSGIIPASWSIDCVGIFTKNVKDLKYVYNVISGYDESDEATTPYQYKELRLIDGDSTRKFKIGVITDEYFVGSEEVMKSFYHTVDLLRTLGHEVVKVSMPESFSQSNKAHEIVVDSETAQYHKAYYQEKKSLFSSPLRNDIENGLSFSATDYLEAQNTRWMYIHEMKALFETIDLLITPATTEVAPEGLEITGSPKFNKPFSNAGLPVLTLPIGLSKDTGLPIGLQVIANHDNEQALIDLGESLQNTIGSIEVL